MPSEFPRTLFIGNPVNEGNRKGRSATFCPGATTASLLGWQDEIPRGDWMRRLIINAILGVYPSLPDQPRTRRGHPHQPAHGNYLRHRRGNRLVSDPLTSSFGGRLLRRAYLVYLRAGGIFKLGERSTASVVHGG